MLCKLVIEESVPPAEQDHLRKIKHLMVIGCLIESAIFEGEKIP